MSTEYLNNRFFEDVICRFQNSKREKTKYEFCIEDIDGAIKRGNNCLDFIIKLNKLSAMQKNATLAFEEAHQQLAIAFLTLAENIVKYAKFNLIDMDDAIQEGVMICFEKIDRFDPQKGKAFNYMTTCILNHMRQLYRTARNYNDFKTKYKDFIEGQVEKILTNFRKPGKPNNTNSKSEF